LQKSDIYLKIMNTPTIASLLTSNVNKNAD